MIYINSRCKEILHMLLMGEDYIPLQRIAAEQHVSRRSIYYDLCKINEWLAMYQIPELEVIRGKGIFIPKEDKKEIEAVIENSYEENKYIFSPAERMKIIICYVIYMGESVYIDQLSEYCQVSRNTIFNDLRMVVNQLQSYNLTLEYESKKGYRVAGDEIRIRALFFAYFSELLPLYKSGVITFINREELKKNLQKLQIIEKELNTKYVEGVLTSLAALLPLMCKNDGVLYFPGLRKEEILRTKEFGLVERYFSDLNEMEKIYLCMHLLGSRVAVLTERFFDDQADQSVYEIVKGLVAEFERIACVVFEEKEELERGLFTHISTSLYRYQYGIQIGNPMCEDVRREYRYLFDMTKISCKYLEQIIGIPVPDTEVAYLTLHFGSHLKIAKQVNRQLKILIVCANGMSTSNMLRREVQKLLPYANVMDIIPAAEAQNLTGFCDLVISSVKLTCDVPVIQVHPILTDFDRKNILSHSLIEHNQETSESLALFDVVKKYVDKKDYASLKLDLIKFFQGSPEPVSAPVMLAVKGLLYYLTKDSIRILQDSFTWEESVREAGNVLLKKGSITENYVEQVISQTKQYGTYMFVVPGLLLAHGRPEDGANQLDVAMTIFKNPVCFPDEQQASVIITLSVIDQESHLNILKDIMAIFSIHERVNELAGFHSIEDVYHYIEQIIYEIQ